MDAKSEDTDAFEVLYGNEDVDEVIDWLSLVLGTLSEGAILAGGGSTGVASTGGVMKAAERIALCYCIDLILLARVRSYVRLSRGAQSGLKLQDLAGRT